MFTYDGVSITKRPARSFRSVRAIDPGRPTLARHRGRTTIGGLGLNARVRDGKENYPSPSPVFHGYAGHGGEVFGVEGGEYEAVGFGFCFEDTVFI